jgi:hypothetical protein
MMKDLRTEVLDGTFWELANPWLIDFISIAGKVHDSVQSGIALSAQAEADKQL